MMHAYKYPRPALAVDIAVFRQLDKQVQVLLIQRAQAPFKGSWALPGGFVNIEESLEQSAARELEEETGLTDLQLEQVHTYGDPKRDPRGRVVSVGYCTSLLDEVAPHVRAGSDAADTRWFSLTDLPELAFDHHQIITDAYFQIKDRIE
ncbi:MAG: NUDIX hydrolase [Anaerolineales bacterium]